MGTDAERESQWEREMRERVEQGRIRDPKIVGRAAAEKVDHPEHYGGDTPYEVIKVLEAWGRTDFYLGNAIKYIARAGKKNPDTEIEDLEKAKWYLQRKIYLLTSEREP